MRARGHPLGHRRPARPARPARSGCCRSCSRQAGRLRRGRRRGPAGARRPRPRSRSPTRASWRSSGRSRADIARRAEAEQALREIAARITAIREPGDVLQHVVDEAVRLLRADGAVLDLFDPDSETLHWAYDAGCTDAQRESVEADTTCGSARGCPARPSPRAGSITVGRLPAGRRVPPRRAGPTSLAEGAGIRDLIVAPIIGEPARSARSRSSHRQPHAFDELDAPSSAASPTRPRSRSPTPASSTSWSGPQTALARRAETRAVAARHRRPDRRAARPGRGPRPGSSRRPPPARHRRRPSDPDARRRRPTSIPVVVAGATDDETRDWLHEHASSRSAAGSTAWPPSTASRVWTFDYLADPRIPHEPDDVGRADRLGPARRWPRRPLRAPGGEVIGTLAVSSAGAAQFEADELDLLQGARRPGRDRADQLEPARAPGSPATEARYPRTSSRTTPGRRSGGSRCRRRDFTFMAETGGGTSIRLGSIEEIVGKHFGVPDSIPSSMPARRGRGGSLADDATPGPRTSRVAASTARAAATAAARSRGRGHRVRRRLSSTSRWRRRPGHRVRDVQRARTARDRAARSPRSATATSSRTRPTSSGRSTRDAAAHLRVRCDRAPDRLRGPRSCSASTSGRSSTSPRATSPRSTGPQALDAPSPGAARPGQPPAPRRPADPGRVHRLRHRSTSTARSAGQRLGPRHERARPPRARAARVRGALPLPRRQLAGHRLRDRRRGPVHVRVRRVRRALGCEPEELVGTPFTSLIPTRTARSTADALRAAASPDPELELGQPDASSSSADGRAVPFEVSAVGIRATGSSRGSMAPPATSASASGSSGSCASPRSAIASSSRRRRTSSWPTDADGLLHVRRPSGRRCSAGSPTSSSASTSPRIAPASLRRADRDLRGVVADPDRRPPAPGRSSSTAARARRSRSRSASIGMLGDGGRSPAIHGVGPRHQRARAPRAATCAARPASSPPARSAPTSPASSTTRSPRRCSR